MRNIIFLLILLVLAVGCKTTSKHEIFFETKKYSEIKIKNLEIDTDTITFDKIESSYIGAIEYSKDAITFIDYRFCWIFDFNYNGKLTDKRLGQGRGPNELNLGMIDTHCFLKNGNHVFFGTTNDAQIHDRNWKRINQGYINWKGRVKVGSGQEVKNPSPDEPSIYGWDYMHLTPKSFGEKIYIQIYSEHKDFNGLDKENYYKHSNILAELNTETLEIDRIFGRRTPELLNYKFLFHHSSFTFDIDKENNFYIAHEIDSSIYVYDKDYNVKYAFGLAGRNMDTNYQELGTLDIKKFQDLYFNDRPNRGYYTGIKFHEDKNLVFRSYQKGGSHSSDGLQIYKDKTLISDVDVPKGFKPQKYIYPYLYSTALIDEDNETIKIIKLKISHI